MGEIHKLWDPRVPLDLNLWQLEAVLWAQDEDTAKILSEKKISPEFSSLIAQIMQEEDNWLYGAGSWSELPPKKIVIA